MTAKATAYIASRLLVDVYDGQLDCVLEIGGKPAERRQFADFEALRVYEQSIGPSVVILEDGYRGEEVRAEAAKYGWATVRGLAKTEVERLALYSEIRDAIEAFVH